MKGSVVAKKYKKKVKYYIVLDLPKHPDGRRNQKWFGSWEKKREAEAALPEYLLKYSRKNYIASKDLLLKELASDYLAKNDMVLAKATYKRYASCIKAIEQELGTYKVKDIEPYMIETYFKKLKDANLKPNTIMKYKTVLQQLFKYAIELKIIANSPIPNLKVNSKAPTTHETWSAEEVRSFLAHIKPEPLFIPVLIAVTTGMRLGEILALKWKDVNFEMNTITVSKSKDLDNTLKSTKNKSSRRSIYMMKEIPEVLHSHRLSQKKKRMSLGTNYHISDFICTLDDGTPMTANYVSIMFKRKVEQFNFTTIRFHDLRHTFATISLSQGIHPKVVQEILGHSTIRTTLDTYSHVLPAMHQESMETIQKAFAFK